MSGKKARTQRKSQSAEEGRNWLSLDVRMLRDDIEWLWSQAQASTADPNWKAVYGLALLPHMARIAHEGMDLLRRRRPAQAAQVQLRFKSEIAASRHTVKLLDDTQKLYDGVVNDFERIHEEHAATFPESTNFAVALKDGRLFTTSRAASFQRSGNLAGEERDFHVRGYSYRLGEDIGKALPVILKQFGQEISREVRMRLPQEKAPQAVTSNRSSYYAALYEQDLPDTIKDILTVIESSVNASLHVFEHSAAAFPGPVFRVRFVVVTHALNALDEIRSQWPQLADRPGPLEISAIIDSTQGTHLRTLGALRNRCMHYGIPSNLEGLSESLPDYGLVSATTPGSDYETINEETRSVLGALSDALRDWRSS